MENLSGEIIAGYFLEYGLPLVKAILIFVIGSWVISKIVKVLKRVMVKKDYDLALQKFLANLISWSLKIFLVITAVATLGVETTSFVAIIGAAGLAIGLALQGSLANFAGGVLIIIFKPYNIGDLIEAQGVIGVVEDIEIFKTHLVTPDNKHAIVPNGSLANGNIINFTKRGKIRVDTVVGVGYDEDIKKTKEVLLEVLTLNPKVLKNPAPSVNVMELGDSSVNFAVRPFCIPQDYWDVYFATVEGSKLALDKAGIEIPYPHQVEIKKQA